MSVIFSSVIFFACQDQHNCEKFYEKTSAFLINFESLPKVAHFHKIFEELLYILAIHVMLVLEKLWILYFPHPLKCCNYELLSIRKNSIEKISCLIWVLPQDLVLPPRLLYFEFLILLMKKSFTPSLIYRSCISVP